MSIEPRQHGASLIELIMFVVIISIALTGVMLVTNQTTGHSADTMMRKQALAVAGSMLEEIEAHPFSAGGTVGPVTTLNRASAHMVSEYDGFATSGVYDLSGAAVSGLGDYDMSVSVVSHALDNIPLANAVQITVTVTPPAGPAIAVTGYRTAY